MSNATYQLVIQGTHYHEAIENVLTFKGDLADGSQPMTEGADLVDAFEGAVRTLYLGCLPPTFLLDRYVTRCMLPAGPSNNYHRQIINDARVGTFGTAAQSDNLCPAINLIPPMGVKSGGRIYMPCVPKTAIDNNLFTAGYIAAVQAFMAPLIAGFSNSATVWKLAIYSKKNATSSLAAAFSLSAAIGFQGKRRKPI